MTYRPLYVTANEGLRDIFFCLTVHVSIASNRE
jgi:hypothetical protein